MVGRNVGIIEKNLSNKAECMKNRQTSRKGLKISAWNMAMALSVSVICICLLAATYYAAKNYERLVLAADDYISLEDAARDVRRASDYLTEQVRLYAETLDTEHVRLYFEEAEVTCRREKALELMREHSFDRSREDGLESAAQLSNELMIQELYAMKLVAAAQGHDITVFSQELENVRLTMADQMLSPRDKIEAARRLLFGETYQTSKSRIYENIDYFTRGVLGTTEERLRGGLDSLSDSIRMERGLIVLLVILNGIMFLVIAFLVVKPLAVILRCVRERKAVEPMGAQEFRYLAETYNEIYSKSNSLAESEAFLREKAEHDALTGSLNRYMFQQVSEILKERELSLALLLVDVDRFKEVNDTFGHAEGDRILTRVAKQLSDSFRATDYVFRIGGDEFAAILLDVDETNVESIRWKLMRINERLRRGDDGYTPVSLSIGIACSDRGYRDGLYDQADHALYHVKESGRCGCAVYSDDIAGRGYERAV